VINEEWIIHAHLFKGRQQTAASLAWFVRAQALMAHIRGQLYGALAELCAAARALHVLLCETWGTADRVPSMTKLLDCACRAFVFNHTQEDVLKVFKPTTSEVQASATDAPEILNADLLPLLALDGDTSSIAALMATSDNNIDINCRSEFSGVPFTPRQQWTAPRPCHFLSLKAPMSTKSEHGGGRHSAHPLLTHPNVHPNRPPRYSMRGRT
jgi:hypothetical protein